MDESFQGDFDVFARRSTYFMRKLFKWSCNFPNILFQGVFNDGN